MMLHISHAWENFKNRTTGVILCFNNN